MNAPMKPEHTADPVELERAQWMKPNGQCPCCSKAMLREFVLISRVVVLGTKHSTAKCSQCKAWVRVPVVRGSAPL